MISEIFAILLPAGLWLAIAGVLLIAGWQWGAFSARQALVAGSPRWKAYVLALIIPCGLAFVMFSNPSWAGYSKQVFWGMAAPAFITACFRYNACREY